MATNNHDDGVFYVLVTGANSGLGLAICRRLIDDFTRQPPTTAKTLVLIYTTRTPRKRDETSHLLTQHIERALGRGRQPPNTSTRTTSLPTPLTITLQPELVDLNSIRSVHALGARLRRSTPCLHALILNAGTGGWTGIDWPMTCWKLMTEFLDVLTWPTIKVGAVGLVAGVQGGGKRGKSEGEKDGEEPKLGAVFAANVFGHYLLARDVVGLSDAVAGPTGGRRGRVIWVSSLEAYAHSLDLENDDFQGLTHPLMYESSKRVTDALILTSEMAATRAWVDRYMRRSKEEEEDEDEPSDSSATKSRSTLYLSHPGICSTSIMPLLWPFPVLMALAMWLAQLLGSPWHTVTTYAGAAAPVWLALAPQGELDEAEDWGRKKGKWGSGMERGVNVIRRTEVEGWGYDGVVREEDWGRRRGGVTGRWKGCKDLTVEGREEFVELGRRCWGEMERMREEWDGILGEG